MLAPLALTACIPSTAEPLLPHETGDKPLRLVMDRSVFTGNVPPPTWEIQPVSRNAAAVDGTSYTVRSGDSLRAIGSMTGAGSEAIARVNGLEPPFTIYPGQRLVIPGGKYHRVSEGETGIGIAQAYGVAWQQVVALNDLEEPFILRVGQRLRLPDGAELTARDLSLEKRAAAFSLDIDDVMTGGQPALATGRNAVPGAATATAAPSAATLAPPAGFNGRFAWPVEGTVVSRFGNKGGGKFNNGLDLAAARGSPIRASADGVVAFAGDGISVFGGLVLLDHGGGWVTAYGHADRLDVVRGQTVRAGQVIGISGDTGYADQPQLHFEIRRNRMPLDPLKHLPAR